MLKAFAAKVQPLGLKGLCFEGSRVDVFGLRSAASRVWRLTALVGGGGGVEASALSLYTQTLIPQNLDNSY